MLVSSAKTAPAANAKLTAAAALQTFMPRIYTPLIKELVGVKTPERLPSYSIQTASLIWLIFNAINRTDPFPLRHRLRDLARSAAAANWRNSPRSCTLARSGPRIGRYA